MNCFTPASPSIEQIRNALRAHTLTGVTLTPQQVGYLISKLNTACALAIELEEEVSILHRTARERSSAKVMEVPELGPNIIRLPLKTRIAIVTSNGGGDAA